MKKKFGLLALTGIIALASCSQGNTPTVGSYDLTVKLTGALSAGSFSVSGTDTTTINVTGGTGKATLKKGTYTVTPTAVAGYTFSPASQTATLTTTNQEVTFNSTKDAVTPPVAGSAMLTIDLEGVSKAPVTIKDSKGAVVAGYSNVVVTDNEKISLPKDAYTIIAGDVTGFNAPTGSVAVSLASGDATAKLTYTAVGTPVALGSIKIGSPANGATVPSGATQVTFAVTGTLTDVVCTVKVNNIDVNVNAAVAASGGLCTVSIPDVAGPTVITVSGKDANKAVVSDSVVVNVTANAVSPVVFDPNQQLVLGADNTIGSGSDATGGWRVFDQGVSTGADPQTFRDRYVKGLLKFSYNATAGQRVEVLLARSTGSDIPNNADVQAADVLSNELAPAGGTVKTVLDTNRLGEFEGVREWLVFRVDGVITGYRAIIADNKGPQQANPDFLGASNGYSNLKRDYDPSNPVAKLVNNNWARGDIRLFVTNTDLQDLPFGQAPATSPFPNRHPAGFESIRYYLVPDSNATYDGLDNSDLSRRAKAVRAAATATTAPTFVKTADGKLSFEQVISSATIANGVTKTDGVRDYDGTPATRYRIYAISRDQIGNETASASYQTIKFDNVGPTVTCSASTITDTSPLPFPSTQPNKYLSDKASVNLGAFGAKDNANGIGIDPNAAPAFKVTLGSIPLATGDFDTNKLPDGTYDLKFNTGTLTDLLGNPASPTQDCGPKQVVIDNTDPVINFNRPTAQGSVQSDDLVSVEDTVSDATSGVYQTFLYWNDGSNTQTAPRGAVAHPVEFSRTEPNKGDAPIFNVTHNANWNALSANTGNIVLIQALAIDRAGNATIQATPLVVKAKNTNVSKPIVVSQDGYKYNESPVFGPATPLASVGANGTTLFPNPYVLGVPRDLNRDNKLTLFGAGTTNGLTEKLKSSTAYGRFDQIDWNTIRNYVINTDPTLKTKADLASSRTPNWSLFNSPWVKLGDTATPTNNQFTFTSDLLNNMYWTNGLDSSDYGGTQYLNATYDQFNNIVTDSAGAYTYQGEEVKNR